MQSELPHFTSSGASRPAVGILGLGIMGSAIAGNLLRQGFRVAGCDPVPGRVAAMVREGGQAAANPRALGAQCDVLVSLLPSAAALREVIHGADGLLAANKGAGLLIEASTLDLQSKADAHAALAPRIELLDCPISGTGAQALVRDLSVYASGDEAAVRRCAPVFEGFARTWAYTGPLGHGTRLKYVANLLVAIHNVASAEAMVLGMKAGLDPALVCELVGSGAGGSTVFALRAPLMVQDCYTPATMKIQTWQKDMQIILDFAARLGCPTPLLASCAPLYTAAMAQGRGEQDTAAVCAVIEEMARVERLPRVSEAPL